jgi:hypothetical protein
LFYFWVGVGPHRNKGTTMAKHHLHILVDKEIVEQIQALARQERRSMNAFLQLHLEKMFSPPSSPNGFPPQPIYDNNIPPLSLTSSSPNDIRVEVMPREAKQKRGTRIPPDFIPDEGGQELALAHGLDLQATLDHFRDFWTAKPGQGGVKLDWQATWRNWCRNNRGGGRAAPRLTGLEGHYDD